MTRGAPLLEVQGLRFAWPDAPPLFDGAAFALGAGVSLLYGDTGAGKTTLLRILAGELPAQGRFVLAGTGLAAAPQAYRQQVFRVDALGVRACTERWRADDAGFDGALWQRLAEALSLGPHLDKPMFMLSTGSRRKVALAAALASGRPLVLLDEPTAALDHGSVRALWQRLGAQTALRPLQAVVIASSAPVDAVPLAATLTLPLG